MKKLIYILLLCLILFNIGSSIFAIDIPTIDIVCNEDCEIEHQKKHGNLISIGNFFTYPPIILTLLLAVLMFFIIKKQKNAKMIVSYILVIITSVIILIFICISKDILLLNINVSLILPIILMFFIIGILPKKNIARITLTLLLFILLVIPLILFAENYLAHVCILAVLIELIIQIYLLPLYAYYRKEDKL